MSNRAEGELRKGKSEKRPLELTDIDKFPPNVLPAQWWIGEYKFRYTTGPFLLPQNAGSLDWILLNNDATQQKARVTIFKCELDATKCPEAPGPLVVTLEAGETTHNANKYVEGFVYEVQVECNSQLLFPYVSIWPGNFGVVIPGTEITSQAFVRLMP